MYCIKELRTSIADAVAAKEAGTQAKGNLWANYVRATMYEDPPTTEDQFDARHNAVREALEAVRALSKDEKNSITSAKCVVKKAVAQGLDVWKRDADGNIEFEDGMPIPRGKSDLQNAKSDFDRVTDTIEALIKLMGKDSREPFSEEQLQTIAARMLVAASNVQAEIEAIKSREASEQSLF